MNEIRHWLDCATNNEPESQAGDCDCGGFTGEPDTRPEPVYRDEMPGALGDFLRKWRAGRAKKGKGS